MAHTTRYDVDGFLRELDAIFASHGGPARASARIEAALRDCARLEDRAAELTVLNEAMGFYRSVSEHGPALDAATRALALADELGLQGSEAYATTLINAATARRAAGARDEALATYRRALAASEAVMDPTDRRLAALHNNLSILRSDAGDLDAAAQELARALAILEASSVDPGGDLDIAATLTNLALVEYSRGERRAATAQAQRSMEICRRGGHQADPHFAAVIAGQAEASFRMGDAAGAATLYRQALDIVAECYGEGSDAYAVTAENLAQAEEAAREAGERPAPAAEESADDASPAAPAPATASSPREDLTGLELARRYWEEHGRPLIADKYPRYARRIAAGLVGHGSDCYGFDDEVSSDHDFGPGFCLWLTAADHAEIGEALQADYDALPREFLGYVREETPRARGRRVGVFEIGEFFVSLTGHPSAPTTPHEWITLDEPTLAAATNGRVFADPHGAFSGTRAGFLRMPEDVRLALVSRRLGMASQAGQYNVPRMLDRGDGAAAWLAAGEFVTACASLVFLLNGPASVGYLPYYKWQFAALRELRGRIVSRLPEVVGELEDVMRLASAACFGGAGFGEGGSGAGPAREGLESAIARVSARIATELKAQGLTRSDETFLEFQRPQLARLIHDDWLRAL